MRPGASANYELKDMVAAVPRSGTPETSPAAPQSSAAPATAPVPPVPPVPPVRPAPAGKPSARARLLASVAVALAVVLLFVAYLHVSRTYPENSDESNDLLMAWDLLHGNLLLHGWYLSDVSFITTELPQYALLVGLLGLHTDTAHVAAAMTYTLVVVFAVLLARGSAARVPRSQAWPRMLLTAGLMFAPQLGVGVFILLLSLGHIGTAVPLMLIWLLLDRSERFRPRWLIPVLVGVLMTWALIADPLVLVAGIVPLVAVCAVRVIREVAVAGRRQAGASRSPGWLGSSLQGQWYEVSLAAAAILAEGLASLVNWLIRAGGGFLLHPVGYQLAPDHTWPKHAFVTGKGLLALFGALPEGASLPAPAMVFALVHLAGVALVAWAMWRVARHFLSWPDMISQILLVAIVVNVVLYVPSTLADATDLNAREFAVVLPFGAVLAGRTLAAGLRGRALTAHHVNDVNQGPGWARWQKGLAAALLAVYAASLGYAAAQPSVPAANTQLEAFLAAHHLTRGIGGYWESSVVTVTSGGAVVIRAVGPDLLEPDMWESKFAWYDPATQRATFLVTDSGSGFFNHWEPKAKALASLGRPARTYHVGPYTIYVWNKNLLADLP
jgi:hypothetical protein